MRKGIWCCTAAGVLAAGGVYAAARYACCPESLIYRGLAAYAATMHPLARLSLAAGRCAHGPAAEQTAPQADVDDDDEVPAEPTPVAPETAEAPPPAVVRGPAPIVIHEEEPPVAEGATAAGGVELTGYHPLVQDPAEKDPTGPMPMPYCPGEEAPLIPVPVMPPADGESPLAAQAAQVFHYWMGLLGVPTEVKGGQDPAGGQPDCREDAHSQEHYSGCPYTGYDRPSPRCPATPAGFAPGKRSGPGECSEEPAPKKHKVRKPGECGRDGECPRPTGLDTMEYRRSDGGLNEYGPGPF
jgi:hypothetical protein